MRKPSDLRRYIKWTTDTKAKYGNLTNFLLAHRLPRTWGHHPFTPSSMVPFEDPSDFSVLINDWPYALDPGITHVVVWTRTPIEVDSDRGDLIPESRMLVENFVQRFFVERLGEGGQDRVLWFKNWVALQSVRSLDHIHVLVKDVQQDVLDEWTRVLECHKLNSSRQ